MSYERERLESELWSQRYKAKYAERDLQYATSHTWGGSREDLRKNAELRLSQARNGIANVEEELRKIEGLK